MKQTMRIIWAIVLAMALGAGGALADTLILGSNPVSTVKVKVDGAAKTYGGGPYSPSTFKGVLLDYVYCVDLFQYVNVPGKYLNAGATDTGVVNGKLVNNAGKVAWLLGTYAADPTANKAALQAAIWVTIYDGSQGYAGGHTVTLDSAWGSSYDAAQGYLAALGNNTGNVGAFLWLTPDTTTKRVQGLVGHVPDGGMTLMLLGGALVGLETLRRRSRA